ncbi:class 1 fructose-bisphosphatase [Frigidibacter sp. MR17.24]|uniref:class 1 fructose-bisphosphatase n=1 Tax=Frigidibacter sp. MR17.24 TaxID=3127345 RepID=UPI003012D138
MLRLPNDGAATGTPIDQVLTGTGPAAITLAIANALPALADRLAAGRLHGDPEAIVGTNDSGDQQKALDVGAHEHILAALRGTGVARVLSEEAEEICVLDPEGAWDVAMDPIDGSGSIGIGAPLGLLYTILPAGGPDSFLRPSSAVVAAGYASFGHSCDFGFSLGAGLHIATLDRELGQFRIARENVTMKSASSSVAYNASNERHWGPGLKAWVADMRAGKDGPMGKNFNMRWLGAAVGDLHRILLKGGVFLYPADGRPGYEQGRLRLLYEAAPMAFIVEQAGGRASDGHRPISEIVPTAPHQHCALIFGAADEVALIEKYIAEAG